MPTFERRRMHLGACHELGRANCSTDAAGAVQIEQPRGFGRYLTHWLLLGSEDRLAKLLSRKAANTALYGWHKLAFFRLTQKQGLKQMYLVSAYPRIDANPAEKIARRR